MLQFIIKVNIKIFEINQLIKRNGSLLGSNGSEWPSERLLVQQKDVVLPILFGMVGADDTLAADAALS